MVSYQDSEAARWILAAAPSGGSSAVEVALHVGHQRADSQHGIAKPGFGAVEGLAPVVHLHGGGQADAGRVSGKEGKHGKNGNRERKGRRPAHGHPGQLEHSLPQSTLLASISTLTCPCQPD
jgi:hypothetical protein